MSEGERTQLIMARIVIPSSGLAADANVQPRHPADSAAWLWHPDCAQVQTAFLRFTLEFRLEADDRVRIHVSADQRFQLRLDGKEIGFGPDRGDVEKWRVSTYEVALPAGTHRLEALVWWLSDPTLTGLRADPSLSGATSLARPPVAQTTWRGGFLLAGECAHADRVNTGRAPWRVEDLSSAIRAVQRPFYAYHDIGPEFHIDGSAWKTSSPAVPAVVIACAIAGNPHGVQRPGWRLAPAVLEEQAREVVRCGRIRAVRDTWTDEPFAAVNAAWGEMEKWSALFRGNGAVEIPPRSECTVLWDFEDYVCGYARLRTTSGAGARVRIDWAEALHACGSVAEVNARTPKGHRDEIVGKVFYGFGDEFVAADGDVQFPALWWRSGRYLRVCVRTQGEALTISKLEIVSTGYPLGEAAGFKSSDPVLNSVIARCERTLRACAHEIWTDSPYYEQMAYVGDNRLTVLCGYALFSDDRLNRSMIELFDDSRRVNGLVAERAPSAWQQVSVTYSLLWVLMVRDFAWWRDDAAFVRARLRGVRAMLDEVLALCDGNGLLGKVPGWAFVDWVPAWENGCGPGVLEGDSSIVNLHLLLALRAQVELETYCGEAELAALASRRAARLENTLLTRYWCDTRGLLADTSRRADFSEHAQALGLLAGIVPPSGTQRWVDAWLASGDLTAATVYFSFYVMDALRQMGRPNELHRRFDAWREVLTAGLLTMPEAPEPTRSDCHGWSAHPRWHAAASVAGVRPSAPGFSRVEVAPQFGPLTELDAEVRHPRGNVCVSLRREGRQLAGVVELPPDIGGELHWQGSSVTLQPGRNQIDLR